MEIIGTLKEKFGTQVVSEKFKKREFVLTTEANTPYPQQVLFQATQDKCQILDLFTEGTELKVQFNVRGREWNGPQGIKYFNTLEAWRIESTQQQSPAPTPTPTNTTAPTNTNTTPITPAADTDDLPF